jgi:hypothetical protein
MSAKKSDLRPRIAENGSKLFYKLHHFVKSGLASSFLVKTHTVVVDAIYDESSGKTRKYTDVLSINNATAFPNNITDIEPLERRRNWKKGDKINVNYPQKRGGPIRIMETELYDLCKVFSLLFFHSLLSTQFISR